MMKVGYDPLTADHPEAMATPGTLYEYKDGVFVAYYRAEDADISQGDCVYPASADGTEMTNDVAGGSRLGSVPLGIAMADIADDHYGYVQVGGIGQVDISLASGDFTAGDHIYGDTSNDGKVAAATIGTHHVIGTALNASSSSVLSAGAYRLHGLI